MNRFLDYYRKTKALALHRLCYMLQVYQKDCVSKPNVGIGSEWYEGNPCNSHLDILAGKVKSRIHEFFPNSLCKISI